MISHDEMEVYAFHYDQASEYLWIAFEHCKSFRLFQSRRFESPSRTLQLPNALTPIYAGHLRTKLQIDLLFLLNPRKWSAGAPHVTFLNKADAAAVLLPELSSVVIVVRQKFCTCTLKPIQLRRGSMRLLDGLNERGSLVLSGPRLSSSSPIGVNSATL
mmetsp:Transcript_25475/g.32102  ORF Transcript_25475/g.32102 Transcript_25475/m.32102 type:complete len:159 (-) Transcript_25475:6-482(-)